MGILSEELLIFAKILVLLIWFALFAVFVFFLVRFLKSLTEEPNPPVALDGPSQPLQNSGTQPVVGGYSNDAELTASPPLIYGKPQSRSEPIRKQSMSDVKPQYDPMSVGAEAGSHSRINIPIVKQSDTLSDYEEEKPVTWLVVHSSVQGKSHQEQSPPTPCQDNHYHKELPSGWGVAVVCDGAGSKEYSDRGSAFVSKQAGEYFAQLILRERWIELETLPSPAEWHDLAERILSKVRLDLEEYANQANYASASLGCTVIVLIYSPIGVLVTHIGDGRAAICTADHQWKAVMTPFKGEEANQTCFITSIDWNKTDEFIESTVFQERPIAFALMSDGCEYHSFEVNILDLESGKYRDPNKPFPGFFNPLVDTLKGMHEDQLPKEEINKKWEGFLTSGTEKLKNEPDDKTLILGVRIS